LKPGGLAEKESNKKGKIHVVRVSSLLLLEGKVEDWLGWGNEKGRNCLLLIRGGASVSGRAAGASLGGSRSGVEGPIRRKKGVARRNQ